MYRVGNNRLKGIRATLLWWWSCLTAPYYMYVIVGIRLLREANFHCCVHACSYQWKFLNIWDRVCIIVTDGSIIVILLWKHKYINYKYFLWNILFSQSYMYSNSTQAFSLTVLHYYKLTKFKRFCCCLRFGFFFLFKCQISLEVYTQSYHVHVSSRNSFICVWYIYIQ